MIGNFIDFCIFLIVVFFGIFYICLWVWGPGRYPESLIMVFRSILYKYRPVSSHEDPTHVYFCDFSSQDDFAQIILTFQIILPCDEV